MMNVSTAKEKLVGKVFVWTKDGEIMQGRITNIYPDLWVGNNALHIETEGGNIFKLRNKKIVQLCETGQVSDLCAIWEEKI